MAKKTWEEGRLKNLFKREGNVEKEEKNRGIKTWFEDKKRKLLENLEKEPFKVGQHVLIPRTNGDPSYAEIKYYDKESKKYIVERTNSEGETCHKGIKKEVLKEINEKYKIDGNYYVGKRVLIPRTKGNPTLAKIISVPEEDVDMGVYCVYRHDADKSVNGDNSFHKMLTKAKLDELNAHKDAEK